MDFDTLTRRELQALCKRNRIPANMTTVAMADALKSLEIVDGIEELMHERQSESAQSSIESPVRSELLSPYLPPTGGRSTRRRNVVKEESESVKPATRTRQTARKSLIKNSDAIETPSVATKSNRKKVQMASACRKMDMQLKECVEEEKKDVLVTPAPSGVTSRRRALKKESTVKEVCSTRRSARLAEKNRALLNEKENENSGTFEKYLFAEDQTVEMKLKESIECSDVISEITGIHESSEKKAEIEAASALGQDISVVGGELMNTIEEETGNCIEANGSKPEVKEGGDMEITSSVEKKDKAEIVEENSEENREVISAQELDLSLVPEGEPICANHFETPSVASQSNREKVRRKMDMPLKECVEEEKKNILGTPVPWGVTSRRRASKESTVELVCSTQQSARLAEKNMVLLDEKENENSGPFKKDLSAEDQNVEMNLKESLNRSEEISEITGFHENSEKKDVIEAVSAPEQDVTVVAGELLSTIEEETVNYIETNDSKSEVNERGDMEITSSVEKKDKAEILEENSEANREVVSAQEQDLSLVPEGEPVSILEEETTSCFDADASKPELRNVGDADITMTIEEMDEVEVIPDQKQDASTVSEEQLVGTIEEEIRNISDVEVVSIQEQEVPVVSEAEPLSTIEEESGNLFEVDGSEQVAKEGSDMEIQKVGVGYETETAPEEQKWYKNEDPEDDVIFMLLHVSNEVQEDDVSPGTSAYEAYISVENTEEPSTDKNADCEYKAGDLKENFVLGNEDNFVADYVSFDTDIPNETEEEIYNGKDMNSKDVAKVNVNENAMGIKSEVYIDVSAKALNSTHITDLVILEEAKEEQSNDIIQTTDDTTADLGFDISLMNEEAEPKMKLDLSNWNAVLAELSQKWDAIGEKTEAKLELQEVSPEIKLENVAAEQKVPLDAFDSNSRLTLTPIIGSAKKASAIKKRLTAAVSDNKENIGSGGKLILTKERATTAKHTSQNDQKLDGLSRRKLSKMLKEQLEITSKCSKNENENEAPARQALQALSEN